MRNILYIDKKSLVNLIYLSFIIVWQPIKMLTIDVDGKGRIVFVLTLLLLFYNLFVNKEVKRLMGSKPFIIWLIWIMYAFLNMIIKGYSYSQNTPLFYLVNFLFIPYLVLVLTCYECLVNRKRLLRVLIISLLIYCVLGFFFMGVVRSGDDTTLTLGNMLAIIGSLLVFVLCVARTEEILSKYVFLGLIALVILMIITTATRKAFGVAVLLVAFYGLSIVSRKPKNIIFVVLFAIGAYYGGQFLMDNTYLGERLGNTREQSESYYAYSSDSKFLQFVGDRAPHYVYGWELFKQHPITGIGLHRFRQVTGYPERLHTDYMVQFAENGLVGIILFILYYLWYLTNLFKLRKIRTYRGQIVLGLGYIVALLFLGVSTWTYDMAMAFVCSGIVASYVYSIKYNCSKYE